MIERALDRLERPRPPPAAAAACADGGLRAGDGAHALAGAGARRPPAELAALLDLHRRRARLAGGPSAGWSGRARDGAAARLPLPLAAAGPRPAAPDRAAQARCSRRPSGGCCARSSMRFPPHDGRPRISPRALAAHPRSPTHRARGCAAVSTSRTSSHRSPPAACTASSAAPAIRRRSHAASPALLTNVLPADEWAGGAAAAPIRAVAAAHHRLGRRLATSHLPQGAPTSPALANSGVVTGWTAGSSGLAARSARPTPATPTTWCFSGGRALLHSGRRTAARARRSRRSRGPRASA